MNGAQVGVMWGALANQPTELVLRASFLLLPCEDRFSFHVVHPEYSDLTFIANLVRSCLREASVR